MSNHPTGWLKFDRSGVIVPDGLEAEKIPAIGRETGLTIRNLQVLAPQLEAARQEVLEDLELLKQGKKVPPEKVPLDARFIDLPERLLGEDNGELSRVKQAAARLANEVDRVVVLGIGGSYMGARAMFEALCHPFHNELTRPQRRGCPRVYFEGNNVDNDAVRGLLELLGSGRKCTGVDDSWGILAISKSGETLETGAAFRVFAQALKESCGEKLRDRIITVSSEDSGLWDLTEALQVNPENLFRYPEHVGGRFSVLSPVGLLPAALLGLDVDQLLEGAAAITRRFSDSDSPDPIVLDYVGVVHLMEVHRGRNIRVLCTWGKRLEAFGLWHDQLLAESLGKEGRGATPLVVVNTRDLHSRGQQHQQGRRDKLFTNLMVDEPSGLPVEVPYLEANEDHLNRYVAEKSLADILQAAFEATNEAYANDFRRTADIHLPKLNEYYLGQLFQMFMLATVVEGRLIGINPYGQPGVQAYKVNMERILQQKQRLGRKPMVLHVGPPPQSTSAAEAPTRDVAESTSANPPQS